VKVEGSEIGIEGGVVGEEATTGTGAGVGVMTGAVAGAGAGAGAGGGVMAGAVALAGVGVMTGAVAVAGAGVGVMTGAVAVAGAGVGVMTGAVAVAGAVVGVMTGAVAVAGAVVGAMTGAVAIAGAVVGVMTGAVAVARAGIAAEGVTPGAVDSPPQADMPEATASKMTLNNEFIFMFSPWCLDKQSSQSRKAGGHFQDQVRLNLIDTNNIYEFNIFGNYSLKQLFRQLIRALKQCSYQLSNNYARG
jgi:hypothetical protein